MQTGLPLCGEVLIITVLTWAAVWGLLDEMMQRVESAKLRILIYISIFASTLCIAYFQKHVSVCSLL